MATTKITKNYLNEIKAHNITKEKLHNKNVDYIVLEERMNATELDRDYWKNKWNEIQHGALGYYENEEGYIVLAFKIHNDFLTTFPQEIDYNVISSAHYQRYPYYKIDNGVVSKDEVQYKKYIGGII